MARLHLPDKFKLSQWFSKYQFNPDMVVMCASDVAAPTQVELLELADEECRTLWKELRLGYREAAGFPLLRDEVAKLHGVKSDEVLIATPQELIYVAMTCLVAYLQQ